MSAVAIHLLVALPAEAKPLIRAFGLKRQQPDAAFPRYVNGPLTLVISGPGKDAAGSAAAFLQRLNGEGPQHWINIGISGHAQLEPGACLLAEDVTDTQSGRQWRLCPMSDLADTIVGPLRCVGEAERAFPVAAGYDMESAAIASTLSEFGALSRLHILKIISDNPSHPSRGINGRMVSELIARHLPTLESLISRLQAHAQTR
jgi:hypothetical protein